MALTFPKPFIDRLIDLLQRHALTLDERETLLTEAFYFTDSRPYYLLKREGNPRQFAVHCTAALKDMCLSDERHAYECLLDALQHYCGDPDRSEITDTLLPMTRAVCIENPASPAIPTAPAPPLAPITSAPLDYTTPKDERKPTVFISYSHKDSEFAEHLIADLQRAGHACWIDTVKIKGGDEWVRAITEGINNSYAFISIVSPAANDSTWVRREFLWAEYKKKAIFPIMAVKCEYTIYLMERQVLALHEDYGKGLAQLLASLPEPLLSSDDPDTDRAIAREIFSRPSAEPSNPRRLEMDYLDRLRAEVLFDLEKYTPLGGESQFMVEVRGGGALTLAFMRPEMEHLRHAEHHRETRRFENAVDEILNIQRAVLLGEPGGGKTTTLLSLAGRVADAAKDDPAAPLPLFVRLGRWTQEGQSLTDFIAQEVGALGPQVQTLFDEGRAVPLLDGMNELPVSQRAAKYPQIEAFIKRYPTWTAVASCREQDYTVDLGLDRITIRPLDPLRIREFVVRYLGEVPGEALFWKIAGEEARHFEARFKEKFADTLPNWQTVFWLSAALPEGLNWQYETINSRMYRDVWDGWRGLREQAGSLMQLSHNPYMLSMLTQVHVERGDLPTNRGQLFSDFVETLLLREKVVERDKVTTAIVMTAEAEALLDGLAQVAYEMQVQRAQSKDGNAVTVLPLATVSDYLNERHRYLAGSCSILDLGAEVRFTHQLLQEYFAARRLNTLIFDRANPQPARALWPPPKWWKRTNWEEAVILLAGFYSNDCTPIVEWVNQANPEVAALCVTRSGAALADATRERLRSEWIPRLTDEVNEPNPQARAAVGRALGLTNWDNRKGVNLAADGLPDVDWVEIAGGTFIYGDNNKQAYSNFAPPADQETLTLPTFYISRYPITYAQFQAFVDDPNGFYQPAWWQGFDMPADHNRSVGAQAFPYWNHPRERVSWFDAMAFCRWWTWKLVTVGARSVTRPDATTARPDATTARPDATIARPDATTARPDATTAFGHAPNNESRVADDRAGYDNRDGSDGLSMRGGSQTAPLPADGRLPIIAGVDWMNPLTWAVRLPTEFEWEKAARGTDGRFYPYGNEFDAQKGNTRDTGLNMTSAVGMFGAGASPYGVLDMSGNVLEWCLTEYNNPNKEIVITNKSPRVARGGSWLNSRPIARAADRFDYFPITRYYDWGFRVATSAPIPSGTLVSGG